MTLQFQRLQLPNGLEVIAEVNDAAHSVAVGFMVKTGARDDSSDVSGVSHFLEHMMFKGTAKRNSQQVNEEFDAMGAKNNAFTSNEVTCYWAQVLPEFTERALELLADMMRPRSAPTTSTWKKKSSSRKSPSTSTGPPTCSSKPSWPIISQSTPWPIPSSAPRNPSPPWPATP